MTELEVLESDLLKRERAVQQKLGQVTLLEREIDEMSEQGAQLTARRDRLEDAVGVLNSYADERQNLLQGQIEALVTEGLRTVFGDDMSFHAVSSSKGKQMITEFVIRSKMGDVEVETGVMEARGGGVASIAGFLIRLVLLLLKPQSRPLLFLDESFAQVSSEYEPALAEFLAELVARTNVQLVLVTHSDAYSEVADVVYRFKQKDGVTSVQREV